jgi:hypothetical protein
MAAESLLDIARRPAEEVLKGLRSDNRNESIEAGQRLNRECAKFAIGLRDYLTLAVQTDKTQMSGLTGYEAALAYLNLPIRDDFKQGIVLQAASDTFQTYPGTRALFPPVIDDILYWTQRQDHIETILPMLAQSRSVSGPEVLFTVVDDDGTEYNTTAIPEGGRVPVRSIKTHEATVRMYKHGSGIRTSYEFNRRARLDLLTPFAGRVARQLELSKIKAAIAVLVNGDGITGSAAPVINQSAYNTPVAVNATNGMISYLHLLYWFVQRAMAGTPVDTVIGNFDAMFQWMRLFQPTINGIVSPQELIKDAQGPMLSMPSLFPGPVKFAVSNSAPAGCLIGLTRAETIEELREAGGDIAEEDRAILNQTITYIRTEVTGYRLLYRDTRSIFNYTA